MKGWHLTDNHKYVSISEIEILPKGPKRKFATVKNNCKLYFWDSLNWKEQSNLLLHIEMFNQFLQMSEILFTSVSFFIPWQPNHCWLRLMVPEFSKSLLNLLHKFSDIPDMSDVLSNYSIINNLTRIINDLMACLFFDKNKVILYRVSAFVLGIYILLSVTQYSVIV